MRSLFPDTRYSGQRYSRRSDQLQLRDFLALLALADGLEILVLELGDGGLHGPGDGFTVGADRAASHLVRDVEQQGDVGLKATTGRDALRDAGEPEGAFATGRALTAGLVGVEGVEVGERLDHLDGIVEDDGSSGAEARATRGDAIRVERDVFHRPVELGAVGELALEAFADFEDLGGVKETKKDKSKSKTKTNSWKRLDN